MSLNLTFTVLSLSFSIFILRNNEAEKQRQIIHTRWYLIMTPLEKLKSI